MAERAAAKVAVEIFNKTKFPDTLSTSNAWMGIYRTLLWYEKTKALGYDYLPHIIDADKLRPARGSRKQLQDKLNAWQRRAVSVTEYLSSNFNIPIDELPRHFGKLFKHPNWRGMQKQNPLGIGFVGLILNCLTKFVTNFWDFEPEVPAKSIFPDIKMTGRSKEPKMDILGRRNGIPRAIVSCKWSIRHDRLGDVSTECTVYKSEALRSRTALSFYLITNEFDPARLSKILDDTCLDGVIHVHKPAVIQVCNLDGRLDKLYDLSAFFDIINGLN
jgi:hypothetical protein